MYPPTAQRSATAPEMMVAVVAAKAHWKNHPAKAVLGKCPLETRKNSPPPIKTFLRWDRHTAHVNKTQLP